MFVVCMIVLLGLTNVANAGSIEVLSLFAFRSYTSLGIFDLYLSNSESGAMVHNLDQIKPSYLNH